MDKMIKKIKRPPKPAMIINGVFLIPTTYTASFVTGWITISGSQD